MPWDHDSRQGARGAGGGLLAQHMWGRCPPPAQCRAFRCPTGARPTLLYLDTSSSALIPSRRGSATVATAASGCILEWRGRRGLGGAGRLGNASWEPPWGCCCRLARGLQPTRRRACITAALLSREVLCVVVKVQEDVKLVGREKTRRRGAREGVLCISVGAALLPCTGPLDSRIQLHAALPEPTDAHRGAGGGPRWLAKAAKASDTPTGMLMRPPLRRRHHRFAADKPLSSVHVIFSQCC